MDQGIDGNKCKVYKSVGICRVTEHLYPQALEFFTGQVKILSSFGSEELMMLTPQSKDIIFAAMDGNNLAGLVFIRDTESAVIIMEPAYYGGGAFLRLLLAMDEYLKGSRTSYELIMPGLPIYRRLAKASGCFNARPVKDTISTTRSINLTKYNKSVSFS